MPAWSGKSSSSVLTNTRPDCEHSVQRRLSQAARALGRVRPDCLDVDLAASPSGGSHRRCPTSPHDGRRTWTGDLLDATGDLAALQGLAGPSSRTTTARYDRRPVEMRRHAAAKLHLSCVEPGAAMVPPNRDTGRRFAPD